MNYNKYVSKYNDDEYDGRNITKKINKKGRWSVLIWSQQLGVFDSDFKE